MLFTAKTQNFDSTENATKYFDNRHDAKAHAGRAFKYGKNVALAQVWDNQTKKSVFFIARDTVGGDAVIKEEAE